MNRHGSMNRIYRLVWNRVKAGWVPVAENAKGCGKSGARRVAGRRAGLRRGPEAGRGLEAERGAHLATLSLTASSLVFVSLAQAGPSGGRVVAGAASIAHSGAVTTIDQSTQNLSVNWQSFDIEPQETVTFVQPSASAVAVNRIVGAGGSQILGHLNANGQVYLINPDGIVFGKGAQVDVGGLVASTLDLSDESFVGSAKSFSGSAVGSIVNRGSITAATGGYVALVANHVVNQGSISARLGTVALGGRQRGHADVRRLEPRAPAGGSQRARQPGRERWNTARRWRAGGDDRRREGRRACERGEQHGSDRGAYRRGPCGNDHPPGRHERGHGERGRYVGCERGRRRDGRSHRNERCASVRRGRGPG